MTATAFTAAKPVNPATATAAGIGLVEDTLEPLFRVSGGGVDPRGCPVGTTSQAAQDHAEKAIWRLASYFGDPLADLDAAIAADPAWILPHLMKTNALLTMAEQRSAVGLAGGDRFLDAGAVETRAGAHLVGRGVVDDQHAHRAVGLRLQDEAAFDLER